MTCAACHRTSDGVLCDSCAAFCSAARDGFLATPILRGGRATAVASTSIEEHCQDWPTYTTERKEACRPRFLTILEGILDLQVRTMREYAARIGLTIDSVVREIVNVAQNRVAAADALLNLHPGDHLILFGHAGGAFLSSHPLTATSAFAANCARQGVRLHIASLGLDLTSPLGQYSIRLAQDALQYWNTRQSLDRFGGGLRAEDAENNLFGLIDTMARWDARVRWVVRGVRSGLSPADLAERGAELYMATVLPRRGTKFALSVNTRRGAAIESVCSARYLCLPCGVTIMPAATNCPKCGGKPLPLGKGTVVRGVRFSEFPDIPVDRQLLACWDFHRRLHPGEDAIRPWESAKSP